MKEALQQMRKNKKLRQAVWILSIAALILYPLRHVNVGVDLWDGGYNYANFRYSGADYMDAMWYFATWLANGIGSLIMRLPFGSTMLGMNVYTGLFVSTMATVSYFFCVKKLKMPALLAFVGLLAAVSLCWLPTSALYNYLTYLFLLVGICLLYQGLVSGKGGWLIAAGVVLGLNVGNRFSNIVQTGLIMAVWAYGFFAKKNFMEVVKDTGFCILGYVAGLGSFLLVISLCYGFGEYTAAISRLFQMTENAVDYKPVTMLTNMFSAYYESGYWTKRFLVMFGGGFLVCLLPLPEKFTRLKKGICVLITVAVMVWLAKSGFNYRDVASYDAIYAPCVMLFEMMILLALARVFNRKAAKEDRLFAILLLLMISIAPLGSNNVMYCNINNAFLILPGFLWMGWNFCRERKEVLAFPVKCVFFSISFFALLQCAGFGLNFVYEEASGGRGLEVEFSQIPVLNGMKTGKRKVENLEGLYEYLSEEALLDRECILYGDIPGISYYMGLTPAMNIWGDLLSYGPEVMQKDLDRAMQKVATETDYPLVILERRHADYLETGEAEGLFYNELKEIKLLMLQDFMQKQRYELTYNNEGFAVYRVE